MAKPWYEREAPASEQAPDPRFARQRFIDRWHEPVGHALLCGAFTVAFMTGVLDVLGVELIGAWMWALLVPGIGGLLLAEW